MSKYSLENEIKNTQLEFVDELKKTIFKITYSDNIYYCNSEYTNNM